MLTHCGPSSNYSSISLSGRGFVAAVWGGRVSGSSPVPLGFSSSPSQLQRPPKIHSKAPPHATPFAWIIKLLPAQFGCSPLPKEQQAELHSSRQLCTAHSSPTAPLRGEWHREAHPQWAESGRGAVRGTRASGIHFPSSGAELGRGRWGQGGSAICVPPFNPRAG